MSSRGSKGFLNTILKVYSGGLKIGVFSGAVSSPSDSEVFLRTSFSSWYSPPLIEAMNTFLSPNIGIVSLGGIFLSDFFGGLLDCQLNRVFPLLPVDCARHFSIDDREPTETVRRFPVRN